MIQWQRGWDSNPRVAHHGLLVFKTNLFNLLSTPPYYWQRGRGSNPRTELPRPTSLANSPLHRLGYLSKLLEKNGAGGENRTHNHEITNHVPYRQATPAYWWTQRDSNSRLQPCKGCTLPTELWAHMSKPPGSRLPRFPTVHLMPRRTERFAFDLRQLYTRRAEFRSGQRLCVLVCIQASLRCCRSKSQPTPHSWGNGTVRSIGVLVVRGHPPLSFMSPT